MLCKYISSQLYIVLLFDFVFIFKNVCLLVVVVLLLLFLFVVVVLLFF